MKRHDEARGCFRIGQRLTLRELMLLAAGAAFGLWLVLKEVQEERDLEEKALLLWFGLLGGLSVLGPPLLLLERLARKAVWHAGKLLWFAQGMASWLLWPPVIYHRVQEDGVGRSMAFACYFYGTPLMAIYVTSALWTGGRLGRKQRRRMARSWREQFGLVLGLIWACTGFYILYLIYSDDFDF